MLRKNFLKNLLLSIILNYRVFTSIESTQEKHQNLSQINNSISKKNFEPPKDIYLSSKIVHIYMKNLLPPLIYKIFPFISLLDTIVLVGNTKFFQKNQGLYSSLFLLLITSNLLLPNFFFYKFTSFYCKVAYPISSILLNILICCFLQFDYMDIRVNYLSLIITVITTIGNNLIIITANERKVLKVNIVKFLQELSEEPKVNENSNHLLF